MDYRKPKENELRLIEFLISSSKFHNTLSVSRLIVKSLKDGCMGSLKLSKVDNPFNNDRLVGEMVSEFMFKDVDNVKVIASLYIDNYGNLFELDIWKTDFSELIEIPNSFD